MAVASTMRRLLQVLEMEEEQARVALESALGDLRLLEQGLATAVERNRMGRRLVTASVESGDLSGRWAGLEEARVGNQRVMTLKPRIVEAELVVSMRRQTYLASRVERRQVETLIEEAEAREALEALRRSQQALDDWYLNQLHRKEQRPGRGDAAGNLKRVRPSRAKLEEK